MERLKQVLTDRKLPLTCAQPSLAQALGFVLGVAVEEAESIPFGVGQLTDHPDFLGPLVSLIRMDMLQSAAHRKVVSLNHS
jgi:hypothetical protein